jgi:hypothetical protein
VLIHFACTQCGASLAAREDWVGKPIKCVLCHRENLVPAPEGQGPAAAAPTEEEKARAAFAEVCARRSLEEAREIAWIDAQRAARRWKALGAIVMALGAAPVALSAAAIASRTLFGFPMSSLAASMVCGTFAMLIGLALYRRSDMAVELEYRRLLPAVIDRITREHWRAWEAQRRTSEPHPQPMS